MLEDTSNKPLAAISVTVLYPLLASGPPALDYMGPEAKPEPVGTHASSALGALIGQQQFLGGQIDSEKYRNYGPERVRGLATLHPLPGLKIKLLGIDRPSGFVMVLMMGTPDTSPNTRSCWTRDSRSTRNDTLRRLPGGDAAVKASTDSGSPTLPTPHDTGLFFKLHRTLMFFVNQRLKAVPVDPASPDEFAALSPEVRLKVRDAFLKHTDLLQSFVDEAPVHLSGDAVGASFDPGNTLFTASSTSCGR